MYKDNLKKYLQLHKYICIKMYIVKIYTLCKIRGIRSTSHFKGFQIFSFHFFITNSTYSDGHVEEKKKTYTNRFLWGLVIGFCSTTGLLFSTKNIYKAIKYVWEKYIWELHKCSKMACLQNKNLWVSDRDRTMVITFLNIEIHSFILATCLDIEMIVCEFMFSTRSSKCIIWHIFTNCPGGILLLYLSNTAKEVIHLHILH